VARRFVSPDGLTVLVGRTAADNDVLSLRLGAPRDFWLHVAGESGSHVVVRNPQGLDRMPRDSERFAAALAARYSKARRGGRVAVHLTTCAEVSKQRGMPPGQVSLGRYRTVQAVPWQEGATGTEPAERSSPASAPSTARRDGTDAADTLKDDLSLGRRGGSG
jgi:predicted ribosome quality control (RQC) complex YloA/Tae2 family protein